MFSTALFNHEVVGLIVMTLVVATVIQGQQTTAPLTATPVLTISLSINASIDGNFTGNYSTIYPNMTTVVPYVTPSIISPVSNNTASASNVFFVEFKLLSENWNEELTKRSSDQFIILSNKVTKQIDKVYTGNNTHYNGSLVIGFREGVYVTVKVAYSRTVIVNTSLVNPLMEYFRTGGSLDFVTDDVFFKMSKYADCIITYIETNYCECETKTYKMQIKCYQPDVTGGEACPHACWAGQQISGRRPCSWDDLDKFLCSSGLCQPHVAVLLFLAVLAYVWNVRL